MKLKIELITGNINKITTLDFLLIGNKNSLKEQICREIDASFQVRNSQSAFFPHQYELLEAPVFKWKRIVAIKFRSNGKISEAQFAKIGNALSVALVDYKAQNIGILPVTWRNPEYCALGIIYSIWLMGYFKEVAVKNYYPKEVEKFIPNPNNTVFKIVSQTGTKHFQDVLQNDCQIMWDFIQALSNKNKENWLLSFDYRELKKSNVQFNVTEITLT